MHAWRHTHTRHLIRLDFDVLAISRRLGHGSPSVTLNIYGHLFPGGYDRAAEGLNGLFFKALTE